MKHLKKEPKLLKGKFIYPFVLPHVTIKCYPGRTEEQKKKCAESVALAISNTLGCDISAVSLEIDEIEKENWTSDVWDKEISPNMEKLYIKPGYKPENR